MSKRRAVVLGVFGLLSVLVFADGGPSSLSRELSALVDEVVSLVERAPESVDGQTVSVAVAPLTSAGEEVPLGRMFALGLSTRLANLGGVFRVMADSGADARERADYTVSGEIFATRSQAHVFVQLIRSVDGVLAGGVERSLPMTAEVAALVGFEAAAFRAAGQLGPENAYELGMNETVTGRAIGPERPHDWYRITAEPREGQILLTVSTTGTTDTYIEAYGPDDATVLLAENDDAEDINARVSVLLGGGETIWVKVRGYDDTITGGYALHAQATDFSGDPLEPDDEMSQANLLSTGGDPLDAMIIPGTDIDWYYVDLTRPLQRDEILSVETFGSLDTVMELYDDSGTQLLSNDDGGQGGNARIDAMLEGPARYYVRVSHYDGSDQGAYRIRAVLLQTAPDEYEPDNDRQNASPIAVDGTDQVRNFTPADDVDWIRFELSSAQTALIRTHGDIDTYLKLYDRAGNLIGEDDDSGEGYNARIERFLPEGSYYVQITQVEGDWVLGAEYRVTVNAY